MNLEMFIPHYMAVQVCGLETKRPKGATMPTRAQSQTGSVKTFPEREMVKRLERFRNIVYMTPLVLFKTIQYQYADLPLSLCAVLSTTLPKQTHHIALASFAARRPRYRNFSISAILAGKLSFKHDGKSCGSTSFMAHSPCSRT